MAAEGSEAMVACEGQGRFGDAGYGDRPWPQTIGEFELLVKAFQDQLVRYGYRRLGNLHDAEDAVQDVFIRAYTEREKLKSVTHVRAYLFRMTANRCSDLIRRRKFQVVSIEELSVGQTPSEGHAAPMELAAAQQLERVEALLKKLPPRQAEAVRLRLLDELTPSEIATVLRSPVTAIKSRLRHGLERLRQLIAGAGEQEP